MAGRTHQAENRFAISRALQSLERGADGCAGVIRDSWMEGSIGVEILAACERRDVSRRMRAQDRRFVRRRGFCPRDRQIRLGAQRLQGCQNARGSFRMAGARIAGTGFVRNDFHVVSIGRSQLLMRVLLKRQQILRRGEDDAERTPRTLTSGKSPLPWIGLIE
jgi:hypothetical protein